MMIFALCLVTLLLAVAVAGWIYTAYEGQKTLASLHIIESIRADSEQEHKREIGQATALIMKYQDKLARLHADSAPGSS